MTTTTTETPTHAPTPTQLTESLGALGEMLQFAEDMREHYADAHREDSDRMTALLHDGRAALDHLAVVQHVPALLAALNETRAALALAYKVRDPAAPLSQVPAILRDAAEIADTAREAIA